MLFWKKMDSHRSPNESKLGPYVMVPKHNDGDLLRNSGGWHQPLSLNIYNLVLFKGPN